MIKVKDGYAKLIGTTYQGSATQVLLSNGGDLEYSASSKASTLVQRNASQHIYATYFNSAISDEALTDIGSVYVRNTSDTFIRRVSKTQFYSILDDKFVTLDTTQSITGAKTFSTSVRFANNASIIQNQNDTSNYTTILKWYKNGASRNTYDPSIGQHNTGGDGNGSICILPYPTATSPWGGTVGLFISKGVLKLDGKSVALAENYYTKTESDERYVNVTGDTMTGPLIVKAAITGTQLISTIATGTSPLKVTSTTVVANLNSDLLDGLHETSFFRARGDQSIASSVPTTTELATSNNLCGSWNVKYTGASGHLVQFNAGSGSTRYMQFYSMYSGSLYWRNSTDSTLNTKSWKTIVDSANYTGIVLKIGTATKGSATLPIYLNAGTPTACSTTLGVSITGNAATATKLQTARTINGTSFDGTANIVTAYWGTARTISLSGAVTGSASVNGSQNVTITTTYQFGSIDGRYVGGNKTANHGSSGTAYTADTYSSTFVNKAFVAFAERGSWAYANNGYVSTDTGVNIPLAGTAIFQWGASDTNKTQLYITPHNNSGVSNPAANEMLFYTSNGSGYTSAWTRVLTHRNYTNYTVTKTGGGASGTWGISITGTAASARKLYKIDGTSRTWSTSESVVGNGIVAYTDTTTSGRWDSYGSLFQFSNADNPTPGTNGHWLTQLWSGTSNKLGVRWRTNTGGWTTMQTILTNTNYISYADTRYVTALGTSGNYLTWTKNGTTNNITIPYATNSATAGKLKLVSCYNGTTNNDLWSTIKTSNSSYIGTATVYEVYNDGGPTTYGEVLDIVSIHSNHWQPQLWFDSGKTGSIRHRNKDYNNNTWGSWYVLLDNNNYAGTLDSRYVTLTTNQTVSGIKTFSTQQKFTVATGTSPFTVSSTTVVSNLNADMLDGYHANSFVKIAGTRFSQYQQGTYTKILEFTITSGSLQPSITFTWHPSECARDVWADFSINIRSSAIIFYANWKGAARRNLWCVGNGTTYSVWVSGTKSSWDPYGVVQVMSTWGINTYKIGSLQYADTAPSGTYSATAITSGWASRVVGTLTMTAGKFLSKTYNGSADVTVNIPTNTSHLTNDSGFWTGTRYWANIAVSTASSTGTSPTFSTAYTSNWFRSTGSTGWYSQTYGGGIYMTDSTYVRVYNSKIFYASAGYLAPYSGSSWISMATRSNCIVADQNNSTSSAHCLFRAKYNNGNALCFGGLGNDLGFYGFSATNISNGTNSYAWIAKWNSGGSFFNTGSITAAGGFYHNSVNSNSYVLLAGGSYKALTDFAKGNAGSATKGVYVTGGTVTAMTYYLNSTVNSGTSGKLAYYNGATAIASYSTTLGNAWTPVYMNAGVPTTCSYSFCGGYSQPIVLLAGTIYRSSNSSNYWYFTGTKHFAISGMNSSISINGGVACFTFNANSGRSFSIYGAIANHQASTKMTSYTSGESGNIRSDGLYWFGTYTSSHSVYIRACCNADSNNDSTQTRPGAWQTWSGAVTRLSIVLIGYAW